MEIETDEQASRSGSAGPQETAAIHALCGVVHPDSPVARLLNFNLLEIVWPLGDCVNLVAGFSVFSLFSVYSLLRFCDAKTRVNGFNTEDTEETEETEESCHHAETERSDRSKQNFFGCSGFRILGDWGHEIMCIDARA
jgi:hypothetical protein